MNQEDVTLSKPCLDLAKRIGLFMEYWGFKEVHGRIWTILFLSKSPLDANFIKKNLGISKALTSMSVNELLDYNVIKEVKKTAPGTQKYVVNNDITNVILDVLKNREQKMLKQIQIDFKSLKKSLKSDKSEALDSDRLESLGEMVDSADALLKGLLTLNSVNFKDFEDVMTVMD